MTIIRNRLYGIRLKLRKGNLRIRRQIPDITFKLINKTRLTTIDIYYRSTSNFKSPLNTRSTELCTTSLYVRT